MAEPEPDRLGVVSTLRVPWGERGPVSNALRAVIDRAMALAPERRLALLVPAALPFSRTWCANREWQRERLGRSG